MIGFIALIPRLEAQLMGRLFGQDSSEGDVKEFEVAHREGRALLNHPTCVRLHGGKKLLNHSLVSVAVRNESFESLPKKEIQNEAHLYPVVRVDTLH